MTDRTQNPRYAQSDIKSDNDGQLATQETQLLALVREGRNQIEPVIRPAPHTHTDNAPGDSAAGD